MLDELGVGSWGYRDASTGTILQHHNVNFEGQPLSFPPLNMRHCTGAAVATDEGEKGLSAVSQVYKVE